MDLQDLFMPYPAAEIEWRVGSTNNDKSSGLALAYLTARHVMDRLDAVCGPENWQDRYEFHGARTICYLSIRVDGEWITKADGAGDSDVEAEKGAISDALKRAAVKWGVGRYLYDLGNIWVDLETAGRSVKIKKSEYAKLEKALNTKFGPSLSSQAPTAPAEKPVQPVMSYEGYLGAITASKAEPDLKKVFGTAWKDTNLKQADRDELKVAYEAKKAQLSVPDGYVAPTFEEPK